MAQQKVHAVIGGYGSQLVQAQSVVPDRYGIPYVSGGAGATSIYGRSKWVFGVLSPVENLASTQMDFLSDLVAQGKLKTPLKIALLIENTEHGKDFQKGVKDYAKAHPEFSVVLDESFELYAPDFKPLLGRVAAAKADLFMCDAHLEDFISMQRTYTQMGLYHQMLTYGARGADEAGRKGLGAATDYIFASGWWSDLLPYPQVKAFTAKWKAAAGSAPQWYHATRVRDRPRSLRGDPEGRLAEARGHPRGARRDRAEGLDPAGRRPEVHEDGTGRPPLRRDAEQARREGRHRVAEGGADGRARRSDAEVR